MTVKLTQPPAEKPIGVHEVKLPEKPIEKPMAQPIEKPIEKPVRKPAPTPPPLPRNYTLDDILSEQGIQTKHMPDSVDDLIAELTK